ncbi:MAG: helix-turn-helix domain-containing protein [Cyanobacteria bacterium P01_D01_bin.105]
MPAKKDIISLTGEERHELEQVVNTGKAAASKINHARILLKADTQPSDGSWTDAAISQALDISVATIERVRQRFVEHGVTAALGRQQPQRHRSRRLDGEPEAHLVALTCSDPPPGHSLWTLRLLAERMVTLEQVDTLCHETVRQTLKKTNSNLG